MMFFTQQVREMLKVVFIPDFQSKPLACMFLEYSTIIYSLETDMTRIFWVQYPKSKNQIKPACPKAEVCSEGMFSLSWRKGIKW
jgi:hypothetical protein